MPSREVFEKILNYLEKQAKKQNKTKILDKIKDKYSFLNLY